ncbi:MAG: hypothetical protein QME68_00930 [Elusimicrobiota bacterium]|nr:hypothetical protein [Elusimicrobiota bacterium]
METIQVILNLYFALLGAYLSVVFARVLKQNGRVLKEMDEGFKMMGSKMDEGFKLIARLIVEKNEETKKEILAALAK